MNTDPRETLSVAPMSRLQIVAIAIMIGLIALDGFDVLSISFAAPGIAAEWHIDRAALSVVLSMDLLGMAVGSIALGGVADRIGRRPTMLGCLVLMLVGMFMVTTVTQIAQLQLWRAITGLGIGGLLAAGNAVAAEFASLRRRNLCVSLMAIGYPVGAVAGGLIVAHLLRTHDWRTVFYFGALITAAFIPLVYRCVPESVPWLTQQRPARALERINLTLGRMGRDAIRALPVPAGEVRRSPLSDIFTPALLFTTLITTTAYFFHIMTFYFILKWVPKIVADMHFAPSAAAGVLVWANVGGALGGMVFGLVTQRVSVKAATIGMMLLSTMMVTLFGRSAPDLGQLSVLCACAGFCTNAGVVGLYAILAQVFPTQVRASGTGFTIGAGRGGSVLGPIAAGFLFKWGYGLPSVAVFMACGSLIAAVVLLWLPLKPDQPAALTLLRSTSS